MLIHMQARLPEIEQLGKELNARTEELSDVRFQLEEDRATASAAQVIFQQQQQHSLLDLHCLMIPCLPAPLTMLPTADCRGMAAARAACDNTSFCACLLLQ